MQKTISIIRGRGDETYHDFHSRIKDICLKIGEHKPAGLHYTITLEKPPKLSIIPFLGRKIALISIYDNNIIPYENMAGYEGFAGSYAVTEALPIAYTKNWSDGEPTPGICLLTLFRKKKGLGHETFIDRWHNGHTPFTLKVHPIYHYNRNVVNGAIGEVQEQYDGIVEEHCRDRKELLNPMKFFAKSGFAIKNMILTWFDTKSFIDYKSMETYLVQEYHLIS